MDQVMLILSVANHLSPLAVIALLCYIVYILVKREAGADGGKTIVSKLDQMKSNDLHELPEMAATLREIHVTLAALDSYLRAKLNGSK